MENSVAPITKTTTAADKPAVNPFTSQIQELRNKEAKERQKKIADNKKKQVQKFASTMVRGILPSSVNSLVGSINSLAGNLKGYYEKKSKPVKAPTDSKEMRSLKSQSAKWEASQAAAENKANLERQKAEKKAHDLVVGKADKAQKAIERKEKSAIEKKRQKAADNQTKRLEQETMSKFNLPKMSRPVADKQKELTEKKEASRLLGVDLLSDPRKDKLRF